MEAMANPGRRLAVALLALAIVLGSLVLWIGVPIGGFWVAGQLFTKSTQFVMFCLVAIPLTMVLGGFALYRVNGLYESLRGGEGRPSGGRSGWLVSHSDERRSARLKRGPRQLIDVAMSASIVIALLLMVFWFFFAAEMRLAPLP
jgi:hypothetical protein